MAPCHSVCGSMKTDSKKVITLFWLPLEVASPGALFISNGRTSQNFFIISCSSGQLFYWLANIFYAQQSPMRQFLPLNFILALLLSISSKSFLVHRIFSTFVYKPR